MRLITQSSFSAIINRLYFLFVSLPIHRCDLLSSLASALINLDPPFPARSATCKYQKV